MSKALLIETVQRLAVKALEGGAERRSFLDIHWNVAGNCQSPREREMFARPSPERGERYIVVAPGKPTPIRVRMTVRCRKCDKCLALRASQWRNRALIEWRRAARTWFGTLTLAPGEHDRVLHVARRYARMRGYDFDAESFGEQFALRHRVISRYLTLYLKRLRKQSGAKFKYILVAEHHKSGLPHYHCLIHEVTEEDILPKRLLEGEWPHGFTSWRLVTDARQSAYVCKYLSKTSAARVRASLGYGKTTT